MPDDPPQSTPDRRSLTIREGTIADARAVEAAIPEFGGAHELRHYAERLEGGRCLVLIAEVDGRPVGFKVGYEEAPGDFYSWLGGVVPEARGSGVATALRVRQEDWARSAGFHRLRVKSKNRFPQMLLLLITAGYQITGTQGTGEDLKISFGLVL